MSDEKQKNKILTLLNHENCLKRKKGIKIACMYLDEDLFERIKLILQIDEKEAVRKCALEQLTKVENNILDLRIQEILDYVEKNEPKHELKLLAKKCKERRKEK